MNIWRNIWRKGGDSRRHDCIDLAAANLYTGGIDFPRLVLHSFFFSFSQRPNTLFEDHGLSVAMESGDQLHLVRVFVRCGVMVNYYRCLLEVIRGWLHMDSLGLDSGALCIYNV